MKDLQAERNELFDLMDQLRKGQITPEESNKLMKPIQRRIEDFAKETKVAVKPVKKKTTTKKKPATSGYRKVQGRNGVYEIVKKDGTVTGYSIIFKNEFNKTVREKARNPEDDGDAKSAKDAEIYLLQRKDDIEQKRNALEDQNLEDAVTDKPLDQVADRYFNSLKENNYQKWETARYNNHISGFIVRRKELGGLTSSQIKPEDITALQRALEKQQSAKSVNNITNLLRTVIRYGIANDHCKKNPMRRYKPLQVDNEVERVFNPEEIQLLIENAIKPFTDELDKIEDEDREEFIKRYDPIFQKIRLQMFVRTMYYTAQRPESLLRLQKKDINDGQVRIASIKKQKQHYVPIADKLRPYLEEWIKDLRPDDYLFHPEEQPGQPIGRKGIETFANRLFVPLNKDLDYKKDRKQWASLYTLRHSAATQALRVSGNQKLVQSMLNHSDPRVTARYAKLLDTTKQEGFNAL